MPTPMNDVRLRSPDPATAVKATKKPRRSWWLPLLIVAFLGSVAAIALFSAVRDARESWRTAWCTCHGGGQIQLALSVYADEHGAYPPAFVADASGRRMHSWRALLLPYLDANLARIQIRRTLGRSE